MAQFLEAYDALPPFVKNEDEEVPILQVGTLTFEKVANPVSNEVDFLRPPSHLIPRHFDWYADPYISTRIPFELDAYVRYWYSFYGGDV
ncbi:hypothetical protein N0V91_008100 [Didymella pomorum]|uniref:Uncharacterized protein n=1 Tax=Didymella pomorum TaxID=749634 RepID=A0A9W9D5S6_9PLEO|nr:hypothetical protein N0V91_008100 [Didymella pomorum]